MPAPELGWTRVGQATGLVMSLHELVSHFMVTLETDVEDDTVILGVRW